jgi:mannose-1-phosphate guanylyltransferase
VKAFLLAAGVGSRLRPITHTTPKCMLAIGGQPLLDIWLEAFDRAGVDEVLVNLHHLPDVVRNHLKARAGSRQRPAVRTVFEPELLGSAGTLAANRAWADGEQIFLACYADNLTDFDLRSLVETHRAHGAIATLTVFRSERPSAGGVVELDAAGTVIGFTEKPSHPLSDLVNAGMYAFHPRVLDEISGPPPRDISYDLLPRLVGRAKAMPVKGYFRDVGTVDAYQQAQQEWRARAPTGARTGPGLSGPQAAKPPAIRPTSRAWPAAAWRGA